MRCSSPRCSAAWSWSARSAGWLRLSPPTTAYHSESVAALLNGQPWTDWYPFGFAALFSAVLGLLPWLDAAQGTFQLDLGITLLTPLMVFALGWSVWRDTTKAGLAAVAIALNFQLPYLAHGGGWPLQIGVFLTLALLVIVLEYIDRPSMRGAVLAAVLLGAIMLVHATELFTLAIMLVIIALANWRRIHWPVVSRDAALASVIAVVCAAPYLQRAAEFVATGGAVASGEANAQSLFGNAMGSLNVLVDSEFVLYSLLTVGLDLPVRLIVLFAGLWWAVRNPRGGAVLAIAVAFAALGAATSFNDPAGPCGCSERDVAVVDPLPHADDCRGLCSADQRRGHGDAGAGVVPVGLPARMAARWTDRGDCRCVRRCMDAGVVHKSADVRVNSFVDDDARAMAWLRENVAPGTVVVNDGFADAGVWVPFKTGAAVLLPRSLATDVEQAGGRHRKRRAARPGAAGDGRGVRAGCGVCLCRREADDLGGADVPAARGDARVAGPRRGISIRRRGDLPAASALLVRRPNWTSM